MKSLERIRVLFVGDDPAEHDHLSIWLRSEGADFRVSTWAGALGEATRFLPSVVVADLQNRAEAEELLQQVRAQQALRELPLVLLVPRTLSSAANVPTSSGLRYNKYLTKPIHPADLVSAISGLVSERPAAAAEPSHVEVFNSLLEARATRRDLRGVLALLNATGPFRFTAILRFEDDEQLTSLWTYDRENPAADEFPIDATVQSSYCSRVRDSLAPFQLTDASSDPRVAEHPARHSVLSYCGVPLQRPDGSFFGTLCQFDLAPRFFQETTLIRLQEAAKLLQRQLPELSRR
jgi:CheY-like chemotaxis protein